MRNNKRAHARSHAHAQEPDHGFASVATTSLIETLRGLGYSDAYTAASLLAGAKSLIRQMHNKAPWTALLARMAVEAANGD